ncbi:hypothetical protein K9M74_05390 [Candidatus Woesearchaeota archaeon]|nr:hypothetical protein [Candidatus Woesearchaeota archaeon]
MSGLKNQFIRRGVKEQLEPLLVNSGISWGQYIHNKENITKQLVDENKIIIPFSKKFLKTPYEWQAHRVTHLLKKINPLSQILLLPSGSKLFRSSPSHTTLKKGALMPVRYRKNENLDLKSAFIKQIKDVSEEKNYYGWDFEGVHYSTQEFRTVLLYDHIRAQLVQQTFTKNDMYARPFCNYKPEKGIVIVRNMPSFETEEIYPHFTIEGIVLRDAVKDNPQRTFELSSGHNCYKTTYAKLKFGRDFYSINNELIFAGREGREDAIDHHVILAMHVLEEDLGRQGVHIYNPFIKAKLETVAYFQKLHNNVLIDYQKEKNVLVRSPLNIAHIESLLWNYVAYENNEAKKKFTSKKNKLDTINKLPL